MEAVRVNLSSMNFSGSMLPLDGRISKMSPLNIINKYVLTKKINKLYYTVLIYINICMFIYIYQVRPEVDCTAMLVEEAKSKVSLLVFDKLYKIISLWADFLGKTVPKSISSIEKKTLEPMVETKDLYFGITS